MYDYFDIDKVLLEAEIYFLKQYNIIRDYIPVVEETPEEIINKIDLFIDVEGEDNSLAKELKIIKGKIYDWLEKKAAKDNDNNE